MDITTFRIIAAVAIYLIAVGGGLAPLFVKASRSTERFFSLGNCLAAGAFLAAGLLHMIPDGLDALEAAQIASAHFIVAALAIAGFTLALFCEKVAFAGGEGPGGPAPGSMMAYALLVVLSVHSLIAGAALGSETQTAQALIILFAIVAHKGTEAFALGVNLIRGGLSRTRTRAIVLVFSTVTPLGILIGALMQATLTGDTAAHVEGVFDGLAAGTFIYIAAGHIVPEEFEDGHDRGWKFALLVLGLGIMAGVGLVV
jgi:zinc transporter 1/2/3